MGFSLDINARAREETTSAFFYYARINPELGDRFLEELKDAYAKISANPQFYSYSSSKPHRKFRHIKLRGFPYLVVYKIYKTDVLVVSVWNTYRKPFFT